MNKSNIKEYKEYLQRVSATYGKSMKESHSHAICREVAKQYGLSNAEIEEVTVELERVEEDE